MVSLKYRSKEALFNHLKARTSKMPLILDDSDFYIQIGLAVQELDQALYNPRSTVFEGLPTDGMVNVTNLKIDEISNLYYSADSSNNLLGGLDLGIGLLPILTGGSAYSLSSLDGALDYIILKSVLNGLQRKLMNTTDYTLMPVTASGEQYLQIRTPGNLFWVEYLTYLDPESDGWDLFENEYLYLSQLAFAYVGMANVEAQIQAQLLGVGKDAVALVDYWKNKIADLKKEWQDSSVITYIA
jgi:hypothetical protein